VTKQDTESSDKGGGEGEVENKNEEKSKDDVKANESEAEANVTEDQPKKERDLSHIPQIPRELVYAARVGRLDIVQEQLDAGVEVNKMDPYGKTALFYASMKGHTEVVKLLIEKGADVNKAGQFGSTPLIAASRNGRVEVVELLIESGADVNAEDQRGRTALQWAKAQGHERGSTSTMLWQRLKKKNGLEDVSGLLTGKFGDKIVEKEDKYRDWKKKLGHDQPGWVFLSKKLKEDSPW